MDRYDVVWDSPSPDHHGSMPLGNGDIGINAWIEESGDLVFYISKTDSWGDNGRLLKLGKVRIQLSPGPFVPSGPFSQRLSLIDATMHVQFGSGNSAIVLRLWVDANQPVIQVEIESKADIAATASIELWRTEPFALPQLEASDVLSPCPFTPDHLPPPDPTIVEPDTVLSDQRARIGWYHHNIKSVGPEEHARIQGIADFERPDPLLHRTFGAVITAPHAQRMDDLHLDSPGSTTHRFSITVLTEHPGTPESWLQAVDQSIVAIEGMPFDGRLEAHRVWWREFWERSWIHIEDPAADQDDAATVARAYALQRFMNACSSRGRYPIKFNGSIFTVAHPDGPGDADYRRWGPGYWWQNTRLPYCSMCSSGDLDLMAPLFKMYAEDLMPLFKHRTRRHMNHDGAYIPEVIDFWGDIVSETYGWTPFEERSDKIQASLWHKWEWVAGLELVYMMLDYYEHSLDEGFLKDRLLPVAHEILTFYDQHYTCDESGKMVMQPSQALETWWDCTNPTPEVSGLRALTDRLLALPAECTAPAQRAFWAALAEKIPELPTRLLDGTRMLAPAERYEQKKNCETPELYAVFPFRGIAIGKPGLELGVEALNHLWDSGNFGWRQEDIFKAYLGLTEQARESVVGRARNKHAESRFPAFWGPNYDWTPDQCHGGVLLKAVQAMLMQVDGRKIYLFPAWPGDWDVNFKLHAPYKTVITGSAKKGKLVEFTVSPESRLKDIQFMNGFQS